MKSRPNEPNDIMCSFCGKTQGQVKRIIAGPGTAFICDECVVLCQRIIVEDTSDSEGSIVTQPAVVEPIQPPEPRSIFHKLDEYVVGQGRAKKALSVAVYNHYKRIGAADSTSSNIVELDKTNILLIGPTGCGKTLLAQTLARILDVPFAISDATALTEAGYVGEDVEHVLLRLIQSADWDIQRAEKGIIYIDEIDKLTRKSPNPSITRDVSGEGVQQALLKIIEGTQANVPPAGGRKHPHQEFFQINTDNILFICGGAFEGLTDIVEKRVLKDYRTIGFQKQGHANERISKEGILQRTIPDDLIAYGFIPEFIGRLPVIVDVDNLVQDDLVSILTEPKNAIVKQYQYLFSLDNVDLEFTPAALAAAAKRALERKIGARGLRSIMEETLLDVMYELPSASDVKKCIVDENAILGESPPRLETARGIGIDIGKKARKTA